MRPIAICLFALAATPAAAQFNEIPAPVIAECNASASAARMPECLMSGSLAHDFLDLVRQEDYYGSAADPVLSACAERNDSFSSRWSCFSKAVESAVATRELIGSDNIADACVAGISDPEVSKRLDQTRSQMRRDRFGDRFWGGSTMYHPFEGCPVQEDAQGAADTAATAGVARAAPGPSAVNCSAYRDIENLIRTSSADDLRQIWEELDGLADAEVPDLARITGLDESSLSVFVDADDREVMGAGLLLGSFLEGYHPELLQEAMSQDQKLIDHPAAALGDEIAMGMIRMMLAAARENYEASCARE